MHFKLVTWTFPLRLLVFRALFKEMDASDSGDDLFITQSTFRTVDTQDADEAANFLDSSFISDSLMAKGDVVEYWDFSHEYRHEYDNVKNVAKEGESTLPTLEEGTSDTPTTVSNTTKESTLDGLVQNSAKPLQRGDVSISATVNLNENVVVGQEPFVPLMPDVLTNADVDQVGDDVLQAAAKALTTEANTTDRFGKPVSDGEVKQHTGKGYVHIFALENLKF